MNSTCPEKAGACWIVPCALQLGAPCGMEDYEKGALLGEGTFGSVHKAVNKKARAWPWAASSVANALAFAGHALIAAARDTHRRARW